MGQPAVDLPTSDLLAKRAAILEDHAGMQKHNDYWREQAEKHGNKIAERPVAFLCDDEVVVVGDCVNVIYDGLEAFQRERAADWQERAAEPAVRQMLLKVGQALAKPRPTEIRVHQQVWNGYVMALADVGIQVCVSDGSPAACPVSNPPAE